MKSYLIDLHLNLPASMQEENPLSPTKWTSRASMELTMSLILHETLPTVPYPVDPSVLSIAHCSAVLFYHGETYLCVHSNTPN